ncbi:tetratricopeptide repeat protein [Marinobacter halodurans]|uniref:Tetratricopeptide repeat protein n=1 Tax=Marinobacter halodurans TaxID=2528979 RepID=A0ABY1ZFN1_9GAMM|nr:tetratricopeptide repeat protein [Marinobacter halodurans]TBW49700.1 tetratricopeptide repeat protein [Marinobacter halodurans]
MHKRLLPGLCLGMTLLAGCASGPGGPIYVPAGQSQDEAPPPPAANEPETAPRASEQPQPPAEPRKPAPSYQDQSEAMSPAAASLVRKADVMLAEGDTRAAISQLERAQRISPRSSKVYFKLAYAYKAENQLGKAEQFALKGLSLAGSDTGLQRTGWHMLADIRRASGNVAGAEQAEARAAAL